MAENAAGPEPAEVRQERISALVEEQGFVRVSDLANEKAAIGACAASILADLTAADCDVQVAEPAR